jgi:hypothetical protein
LNNNERIIISNPQTGSWQVIIKTAALPVSGNQLFSLLVTCGGKVGSLNAEDVPI